MNDPNVINRQNAKAAAADNYTADRKAGKFALKHFNGLNYVGHTTHAGADDARAQAAVVAATVGGNSELLLPIEDTPAETLVGGIAAYEADQAAVNHNVVRTETANA